MPSSMWFSRPQVDVSLLTSPLRMSLRFHRQTREHDFVLVVLQLVIESDKSIVVTQAPA